MQRDKRKADIKTREDLKITDRFLLDEYTFNCLEERIIITVPPNSYSTACLHEVFPHSPSVDVSFYLYV